MKSVILILMLVTQFAYVGSASAAPPTRDIFKQLDLFRGSRECTETSWTSSDDRTVQVDRFGKLTSAPEAESPRLLELFASFLACEDLSSRLPGNLAAVLDPDHVQLSFDDDGALVYTIGAAVDKSSMALVLERDTYRPLAVHWVTPRGRHLHLQVLAHSSDGWQPSLIRIWSESTRIELAIDPSH